jgi:hypothetical protein
VQHQVYLNGNIPLGKGFYMIPAFNLILDRYETIMPQFINDSLDYLLPLKKIELDSYIGYLSFTKDFNIVRTSIFGAYSNLNNTEQFQAGFGIFASPFGNLNFYLSSKLLNHNNDGQNNIIYEQMIGVRLFKPLWAEANVTFGTMKNYYENNAFVVYNMADKMKFKGGAKLIYMINQRILVFAEYFYLLIEGEYLTYSYDPEDEQKTIPTTLTQDFQNQVVLIGLNWNF